MKFGSFGPLGDRTVASIVGPASPSLLLYKPSFIHTGQIQPTTEHAKSLSTMLVLPPGHYFWAPSDRTLILPTDPKGLDGITSSKHDSSMASGSLSTHGHRQAFRGTLTGQTPLTQAPPTLVLTLL
jgi:hypothetical protein